MSDYIHKAKKSLGQNFLKSKPALSAIITASNPTRNDIVLEIGPGKGALTEKLLLFAGKVIAVEKDDNLYEFLKDKFAEQVKSGQLDLIHDDIENFNPESLRCYKEFDYKIVANIPYNLTGLIFRKFLEANYQPSRMILLVQHEVAKRIVARDKKESLLSLSVKLFGTPKSVMKVPARYFSPAPKVDSAIISIEDISRNKLPQDQEKAFFDILHAGFAHKRKMLLPNLYELAPKERLQEVFQKLSISEKSRAEDIPLPIWIELVRGLSQK